MATQAARAARNREARQRLEAAFAALADRLGVAIPPEPRRMKDPGLQPIVEIERFAAFAEAVLAALPAAETPKPAPDAPKPVETIQTPSRAETRRTSGRNRS